MPLKDFEGQQPQVVSLLLQGLKSSRLSHAYLFYGPEGAGKKEISLELAKAINCQNSLDACGVCLSCQKIDQGNHPDVKSIIPEDGSLKIQQIRGLQKEISYRPYEGERKVYLIEKSHLMTLEAQNALLKTLESPPSFSMLILITENKDALLSTILSRCQRTFCKPLSHNVLSQRLKEEYRLSQEEASIYSFLSGGQLGRAQELARGEGVWDLREAVLGYFPTLMTAGYREMFLAIEEIEKKYNQQMDDVFPIFHSLFRDFLLLKTGDDENLINGDFKEDLLELMKDLTHEEIQGMIQVSDKVYQDIKRHVLKRLALEVMWLKIRRRGDLEDEKSGLDYL